MTVRHKQDAPSHTMSMDTFATTTRSNDILARTYVDLAYAARALGQSLSAVRRRAARGISLHTVQLMGRGSQRFVPAVDLPLASQRLLRKLLRNKYPDPDTIIVLRGSSFYPLPKEVLR